MFLKPSKSSSVRKSGTSISILGDGCSFNGKVFIRGETRIAGQIEGEIISEGVLIVEESAHLKGEIRGIHIQIAGNVEGNIIVSGILRLTPTAKIKGNITTCRLVVEEGATIQGKVDIEEIASPNIQDIEQLQKAAS